jgi:hypothetical protein
LAALRQIVARVNRDVQRFFGRAHLRRKGQHDESRVALRDEKVRLPDDIEARLAREAEQSQRPKSEIA